MKFLSGWLPIGPRPTINLRGWQPFVVITCTLSCLILDQTEEEGRISIPEVHVENKGIAQSILNILYSFRSFGHISRYRIDFTPEWPNERYNTAPKIEIEYPLSKITKDLEKWSTLPNSLGSHISIIKMNVLANLIICVSSMLPLPHPTSFWDKVRCLITKFVWNGYRPHHKLSTMQPVRSAGGLTLPNFRLYYWASTLRLLSSWYDNNIELAWRALEENLILPLQLDEDLFSNMPLNMCKLCL